VISIALPTFNIPLGSMHPMISTTQSGLHMDTSCRRSWDEFTSSTKTTCVNASCMPSCTRQHPLAATFRILHLITSCSLDAFLKVRRQQSITIGGTEPRSSPVYCIRSAMRTRRALQPIPSVHYRFVQPHLCLCSSSSLVIPKSYTSFITLRPYHNSIARSPPSADERCERTRRQMPTTIRFLYGECRTRSTIIRHMAT